MPRQSIAITAGGIICAIGHNPQEVVTSLRSCTSGVAPQKYLEVALNPLPVGEVKMTNREMEVALGIPAESNGNSRTALLGALALRQVMNGLEVPAGARVAFISGTTVGGMDVTERVATADTAHQPIGAHDCGANSHAIAQLAGLKERFPHSDVQTISTACSSALNAIIVGTDMLRSREADIVIAGGAEALSEFHMAGFKSLMILDTEPCRPFCETRRGLNLGEGAAYVVLQRDEGNLTSPLGYVAGYGNRCDAYHQTATSPQGEGAYLAMTDAIAMAGIQPAAVDYVNAHGTATPDNDRCESQALKRVFGAAVPPVSSTKSFTGHTTSASGAIESIICLEAMRQGFLPANLGLRQPMAEGITPVIAATAGQADLHYVLCNSFGFGGNDSSLLISRGRCELEAYSPAATSTLATCALTDESQLADLKKFVPPMESRRMCKLLKAATYTSLQALADAGITTPDAIIVGTAMGMWGNSARQLAGQLRNPAEPVSPMLFMQSTHNTIAGSLAIRTHCHGYNITFSQGPDSARCALADAHRLISSGRAESVLVCVADDYPELSSRSHVLSKCS